MIPITLEKAQQDLPTLIQRVLAREEIVIGTPGAQVKLTPMTALPCDTDSEPVRKSYRGRGVLKGQLHVGPEFFETLSDE